MIYFCKNISILKNISIYLTINPILFYGIKSSIFEEKLKIVPSAPQFIALFTSILMIILSQAKAWYANQPEENVVADIKRKIGPIFQSNSQDRVFNRDGK